MYQELLYTSAPRGLKPGSRGFCTVLSTRGMSPLLATALESLSGYRQLFRHGDANYDKNPVACSHVLLNIARKSCHVVSRVADFGLDYSQRTNKIAHHVAFDTGQLPQAGPAWVLKSAGMMRETWSGEPRLVEPGKGVPTGDYQPGVCREWQAATGDAGWAGVLAESFLRDPQSPVYLIYEPGTDMLPLLMEAIGLLPAEKRWQVTFSTYFTGVPQSVTCLWRCVPRDSAEAHESKRFVRSLRLNLCEPLGTATGGPLVTMARTGQKPQAKTASGSGASQPTEQPSAAPPEVVFAAAPPSIAPMPPKDSEIYDLGAPPAGKAPPPRRRRELWDDELTTRPHRSSVKWLLILSVFVAIGGAVGIGALVISRLGKVGDDTAQHVPPTPPASDEETNSAPALDNTAKPAMLVGEKKSEVGSETSVSPVTVIVVDSPTDAVPAHAQSEIPTPQPEPAENMPTRPKEIIYFPIADLKSGKDIVVLDLKHYGLKIIKLRMHRHDALGSEPQSGDIATRSDEGQDEHSLHYIYSVAVDLENKKLRIAEFTYRDRADTLFMTFLVEPQKYQSHLNDLSACLLEATLSDNTTVFVHFQYPKNRIGMEIIADIEKSLVNKYNLSWKIGIKAIKQQFPEWNSKAEELQIDALVLTTRTSSSDGSDTWVFRARQGTDAEYVCEKLPPWTQEMLNACRELQAADGSNKSKAVSATLRVTDKSSMLIQSSVLADVDSLISGACRTMNKLCNEIKTMTPNASFNCIDIRNHLEKEEAALRKSLLEIRMSVDAIPDLDKKKSTAEEKLENMERIFNATVTLNKCFLKAKNQFQATTLDGLSVSRLVTLHGRDEEPLAVQILGHPELEQTDK